MLQRNMGGIQGDTSGKLDFKTFNGKSIDDCIKYIYKKDSVFTSALTLYGLISSDLANVKPSKNRPSRSYLLAIQKACNKFNGIENTITGKKDSNKYKKKKIDKGIEVCQEIQKAFKGATKVSKEGAFLHEDDVKVYMERQSRALKLSVAKMKALLLKESTKNPIKKMLASSKEKYIQKKEAKYSSKAAQDKAKIFLLHIKRENARFRIFSLENRMVYYSCRDYLFDDKKKGGPKLVAEKLVKILDNLLSKEKFEDNEKGILENIKTACSDFLATVNGKPGEKLGSQVIEYDKIAQAFKKAQDFPKADTPSFLYNKDMKEYLSKESLRISGSANIMRRLLEEDLKF